MRPSRTRLSERRRFMGSALRVARGGLVNGRRLTCVPQAWRFATIPFHVVCVGTPRERGGGPLFIPRSFPSHSWSLECSPSNKPSQTILPVGRITHASRLQGQAYRRCSQFWRSRRGFPGWAATHFDHPSLTIHTPSLPRSPPCVIPAILHIAQSQDHTPCTSLHRDAC